MLKVSENVESKTPERRSADLSVVDALRGIAALAVVLYHVNHWYFQLIGLSAPFAHGYLGVQLFFVISGFCIHLPVAQGRSFVPSIYCYRRFFRIYPPYLAVVGLLFIAAFWQAGWRTTEKANFQNLLGHLFGWHYWSRANDGMGVTPVLWTITIEIHFYLLYLIWRTALPRISTIRLLIFSSILALAYRGIYYNWFDLACNLHPFFSPNRFPVVRFCEWLAGAWIAELFVAHRLPSQRMRFALLGFGAGSVVLGVMLSGSLGIGKYALNDISASAGFACILGAVLPMKPFHPYLMYPLTYLGKISYSLYLVHAAVISFLVYALSRSTFGSGLIALPVIVAAIWGTAHLFWKVVEKPSHLIAQKHRCPQNSSR